jgi:hypothetical protein
MRFLSVVLVRRRHCRIARSTSVPLCMMLKTVGNTILVASLDTHGLLITTGE